jgi:integrase
MTPAGTKAAKSGNTKADATKARGTFVQRLTTRDVVYATKWLDLARGTKKNVVLWDGAHQDRIRGFGVKITPAGNRTFLLQYWSPVSGERRRITRPFEGLTIEQARELAADYRRDIAKGLDPFAAAKDERERRAAEHELTVDKLVPRYLTAVARRLRGKRSLYERTRILTKHAVPLLGDRPVATLTRRDVKRLHSSIDSPTTANRTVEAFRAFLNWAADEENIPLDVAVLFKSYGGKRGWKHREESSERFLSMDEFRTLGNALARAETEGLPVPERLKRSDEKRAQENAARRASTAAAGGRVRGPYKITKPREPAKANPIAVAAIRFAALSGWRENEVLSLRWDAIDWTRAQATLRETKTGKSYRQLGAPAMRILEHVRDEWRVDGNPFVFAGADEGQHLKELQRPWYATLEAAKLSLRFHDLRHSFASVAADRGYSELVIGGLLGHRKRNAASATSRYAHLSNEVMRRAADEVAGAICDAMTAGAQPAKVLPIKRTAG